MINVAKKKLPKPLISILVYVSYCASCWFVMRGNLAYYGYRFDMPSWFVNDVWAFFLGGIIPLALFEIVSSAIMKRGAIRSCGGDVQSLRYGLNYAVIAANILLFLLKFMYIAIPLYAPILDIILDPTLTLAFVGLYMWYAFYQDYIDRTRYSAVLSQVMNAFLTVYGILTAINLILTIV